MSSIRALDEDGDWTGGAGLGNYLTDLDCCAQDLSSRIQEFINDCFWNTSAGIDWLNLLGSKDELGITVAIENIAMNTNNVTGILRISLDLSKDRGLTIFYDVTTVFTSTLNPNGLISGFINLITDENGNILTTETGDDISA